MIRDRLYRTCGVVLIFGLQLTAKDKIMRRTAALLALYGILGGVEEFGVHYRFSPAFSCLLTA